MLREQIANTLPSEPDSTVDAICSLKCRLPGGKVVSRRFLNATTLSVLFDFLYTQGFSRDEYRFLTTYPKRDVINYLIKILSIHFVSRGFKIMYNFVI